MPARKSTGRRGRPAITPEERENQLISKAVDLAERQLEDGTATAQVITHYLKLGSTKKDSSSSVSPTRMSCSQPKQSNLNRRSDRRALC